MKRSTWGGWREAGHWLFLAVVLGGLLAALLLVSGCAVGGEDQEAAPSPSLDAGGQRACDAFAVWWADGHPDKDKLDVLRTVHINASNSNFDTLDDKAKRLFRVGTDRRSTSNAFTLVADSFAYECQVLGWKG